MCKVGRGRIEVSGTRVTGEESRRGAVRRSTKLSPPLPLFGCSRPSACAPSTQGNSRALSHSNGHEWDTPHSEGLNASVRHPFRPHTANSSHPRRHVKWPFAHRQSPLVAVPPCSSSVCRPSLCSGEGTREKRRRRRRRERDTEATHSSLFSSTCSHSCTPTACSRAVAFFFNGRNFSANGTRRGVVFFCFCVFRSFLAV